MSVDRPNPETQAIDWVIRQRDPAFTDWDAFADWLAADAGHAAVYDALASLDQDLDALPPAPGPAKLILSPTIRPQGRSRRFWFGGALTAALIAAISLPGLNLFSSDQRIETAAGEHRTIAIADGSRIEINGGSVVEIDTDRPRFARIVAGEAMFHVAHRDGDPFIVEAGDARIVDLGTAFNVVRRDRQTSVAVSEGIVLYNPDRQKVRLVAGQAIDARDGNHAAPAVQTVDVASIGSWRTGLLVYNDAPLAQVAEDLQRTAGIEIAVEPAAASLPFRGALIIDTDRSRTIADLAALSGTKAQPRGDGWILTR